MEIEKLLSALEETIAYLNNSESSVYANKSVEEIIGSLEKEILEIKTLRKFDKKKLQFLFGPTSSLQETSIDNGWGNEFLRISTVIDQFVE